MAPIRRHNSRVQAEMIQGMLGLCAPNDGVDRPVTNLREITDPLIKFLLGQYTAIERQRAEFLKMFGPLLEGAGIHLSSFESGMEDSNTNFPADDNVLNGDATANSNETINDDVQFVAPRKKLDDLSFQLVASKFGMPISQAAKELQIGRTTLQTWCRRSGIRRWPYRKIRTIDNLLTKIKDYGKEKHFSDIGIEGAIKAVELEKDAIEKKPTKPLQEITLELIKKMNYVSNNQKRGKKKIE